MSLFKIVQPGLFWGSENMIISLKGSLRWINVKQRFMVNDTVMMHKCLNGLSPSYLSNSFCVRSSVAGFTVTRKTIE